MTKTRAPSIRMPRLIIALIKLRGNISAHVIVQPPAGKNDFWMIAYRLCLVGKIVRIDADAVAADQARPEGQKIPLGAGRLEHGFGVDAHSVEDNRQFVN